MFFFFFVTHQIQLIVLLYLIFFPLNYIPFHFLPNSGRYNTYRKWIKNNRLFRMFYLWENEKQENLLLFDKIQRHLTGRQYSIFKAWIAAANDYWCQWVEQIAQITFFLHGFNRDFSLVISLTDGSMLLSILILYNSFFFHSFIYCKFFAILLVCHAARKS